MLKSNFTKHIYETSVDEVDSFDAYYQNVIFRNNNLVIPYIGLGLSNHELNLASDKFYYLNFAYMVFVDIQYLKVYLNQPYTIIERDISSKRFFFGGNYLELGTKVFNDMEIGCLKAFLHIIDSSELSEKMWIPINTPKFSKNMDDTLVKNFFNQNFMPLDIEKLIS